MARSTSLSRLPRRAWFALIVILTLAPAVVTVLDGRDVDALNFIAVVDPDSIAAWVGRLSAAALLALSAIIVFLTPQRTVKSSRTKRRLYWLAGAIVIFALGHTILPSFLGAVPSFEPNTLYAFAVLAAAFSARSLPSATFLSAAKGSLLILMLGGFIATLIKPEMALQYVSADLRLPVLEFRYWGLGSNPNNIAPLALLLMLLTIHTPYKYLWLNALAIGAGAVTLLLSQSQTTWAAALLILPTFTIYCKTPKPIRKARINPLVATTALVGIGIALVLIVWEASHLDMSAVFDSSLRLESGSLVSRDQDIADSFTGRTVIWEVAMDTWREYPWFGYGPTAWGVDFRTQAGVPFASNAHNQLMQSASIGGTVAVIALIFYVATLSYLSSKSVRGVNGIQAAILGIALVRGFTEGPLDTNTLLSGETLFHASMVFMIAYAIRQDSTSKRSRRSFRSVRSNQGPNVRW